MDDGARRVLLVEDDPHVRSVIDRQLQVLGWDVIPVSTGREAAHIIERGMRVQVLLTDLDLPDIDGEAVARAVTRIAPGTRVVYMSGASPAPRLPAGATYLQKPFSHAELARALSVT